MSYKGVFLRGNHWFNVNMYLVLIHVTDDFENILPDTKAMLPKIGRKQILVWPYGPCTRVGPKNWCSISYFTFGWSCIFISWEPGTPHGYGGPLETLLTYNLSGYYFLISPLLSWPCTCVWNVDSNIKGSESAPIKTHAFCIFHNYLLVQWCWIPKKK